MNCKASPHGKSHLKVKSVKLVSAIIIPHSHFYSTHEVYDTAQLPFLILHRAVPLSVTDDITYITSHATTFAFSLYTLFNTNLLERELPNIS